MRESYFRIGAGIFCLLLFVLPSVLPPPVVEDKATETAMLPPCDVDEGLPLIDDDQVTCYWGMSEETLPLPDIVDAVNVEITISWVQSGVWIGIAEAEEASKCTPKDGYYQCDKNAVEMVAGGQLSGNSFSWNAKSGDYRFVAGGDDAQTLQQFEVDWEYEASLEVSPVAYYAFAVLLGIYASLGVVGIMHTISRIIPSKDADE
tara:strand:+ start:53687 stop:54298 length:612 start_codon:yes stop_codon:yes gene_type:complete